MLLEFSYLHAYLPAGALARQLLANVLRPSPPSQLYADDPTYTHFAHRDAFFETLSSFLAVDVSRAPGKGEDDDEEALVKDLGAILDHYLPLPGLLDPHIDQIIPPLLDSLAKQVIALDKGSTLPNVNRLNRLGKVINWIVKVRGWKAVVQHFPSSISFLPALISVFSPPTSPCSSSTPLTAQHPLVAHSDAWETRAVLLLWLALLLTVPFSLSALTSPQPVDLRQYSVDPPAAARLFSAPTSDLTKRVILLAIPLLHRSGKEGAYAALVLARIFSRTDAVQGLAGCLDWAGAEISEGDREGEANIVASILELLALLPSMLPLGHLDTLQSFTDDVLLPHLRGGRTAAGSGLIRKLVMKARGRWWLTKLNQAREADGEGEIPEGLEEELDDLMTGLADKDTIVRYSSAKYIARITAVLPEDYASQIVLATIVLFQGTEDEPVVETSFGTVLDPGGSSPGGTMGFGGSDGANKGESRWHGVCLALAEMARRGLVRDEAVGQAVEWVMKALTFDIRRATHSIGSNVRDAASYVLWSLSRACPPAALAPYAEEMATGMMCAACFDREVGVRRAASAAYQEGVGRLGLYPEGIDVLAKSDFYSVSVRRIAFTVAAPAIAEHSVYRRKMRDCLHNITLRHWDEAMRTLAAVALKDLLTLGSEDDLNDAIEREIKQIPSMDANNVHGGLSALTQISQLLGISDDRRKNIFLSLGTIRPAVLVSPQAAPIIKQACDVIRATLNSSILETDGSQRILDLFIESGMKRREVECQEAVAAVFASISAIRDASRETSKLVGDLKALRAVQRQAAALSLGRIHYKCCSGNLGRVVVALLSQLDLGTKADVETRRYAIRSLAQVATQSANDGSSLLDSQQIKSIISALTLALSDYSTDQRGDVGSWIRVAGLNALGAILPALARRQLDDGTESPIPQEVFESTMAGMVKLLVEKLEPVRAAAARSWGIMRLARVDEAYDWAEGRLLDVSLNEPYEETFRYIDQKEWFGRTMPLLQTKYRGDLMAGLVLCMGSQIQSVSAMAFEPFQAYVTAPATRSNNISETILLDMAGFMGENINSNRVFIPCLITTSKIFRSPSIVGVGIEPEGVAKSCTRIIGLASRGIDKMKSIDRISASMGVVIAALRLDGNAIRVLAGGSLSGFLKHRFPRIRSMCAEQLYLALCDIQDDVNPELEELLLGTVWTDDAGMEAAADSVVQLVQAELGA